jgi:hypothetical protein
MVECQFKFKILTVLNAQESSLFQNGDEPYFIFFGFRSRFRVLDSTRVFWSGYLDDQWARGSRKGSSRNIPREMGIVTFENVLPVSEGQLVRGVLPEVIGVVGIAMESDGTRFETIHAVMRDVQHAIFEEVHSLIEEGTIQMDDPCPGIIQSLTTLQKRLNMSPRESLEAFPASRAKTDDLVGIQARLYLAGDDTVKAALPELEIIETKNINLDFTGSGADYRVSGFMEIVPEQSTEPHPVSS